MCVWVVLATQSAVGRDVPGYVQPWGRARSAGQGEGDLSNLRMGLTAAVSTGRLSSGTGLHQLCLLSASLT